VERDGPLFPLWSALGLELLGRARLAFIHPVLLADPRQDGNILFAFGYDTPKEPPRSIPAKALFLRCQKVVPEFTKEDFELCTTIIARRNDELHTGAPAFDDLPNRLWLAQFYRVCKLLVESMDKTLADLLGEADAAAAEQMIEAAKQEVSSEVKERLGRTSHAFGALDPSEQDRLRKEALLPARRTAHFSGTLVNCPVCGACSALNGERINASELRLRDDELVQEIRMLATHFRCFSCGLELEGHARLNAAGVGGQYTIEETYDPTEYYGEQMDPADYHEEYMNE
jgi:hypothetical protein